MASLELNKFRYDSLLHICNTIDKNDMINHYESTDIDLRTRAEIEIIIYIQHLCAMCSGLDDETSDFIMEYFGNIYRSTFEFEHKAKKYNGDIGFFLTVPYTFEILIEVDNIYKQNYAQLMYRVYKDIGLTFLAYNSSKKTVESQEYFEMYLQFLTDYAEVNLNNNSWTSTQNDSNSWLYDDGWFI